MMAAIDFGDIFQALPGNYIILLPDAPKFTIVSFNHARASETFTTREDIGKGIFEAFPDNPDDPAANGVAMLTASLEMVIREKQPHQMAVQKYDIPNSLDNGFEIRYWLPKNIPVLNKAGEITCIIHHVQDVTTLINAQQGEQNIRKNFEEFLNQSLSPFAVMEGPDFTFTYANAAYITLMNGRQLEGKTVLEAIPELEGQPFIQQLQQVFDTGVTYHGIEVPATAHFEGSDETTTRYFNLSYTPTRDPKGIVTGILAYAYDVTTQVEMRVKAKADELNTQAYDLFMQAPVGICIIKYDDHRILLANSPILEIWGKEASVIGKPLLEAIPEIADQGIIALLDNVKKTAVPFYANEHVVKLIRNGREETAYLNFVYQPYYEADATISGVIAIAIEVTEQVTARKKVELAEETARLAIESADLGAYDISLETDVMLTTPRFNNIWGLSGTIERSQFANAIHPDDRERRLKAHEESLATGKLFYEARIIWKDGSIHWIRIKGTVLYGPDQKPARLIGVIQDITDQRAFADELRRQVDEKTVDLKTINARLEKSNHELEQFAHVTSHDLQEPLRKIQLFSSSMADNPELSEKSLTQINKINAAAKRMSGLTKDLLEYARLSQTSPQYRPTDLNAVLQNVLSDFELVITQKKAVIKADPLEIIEAVSLQMNQLFFNLIGNALKFSKKNVAPVIAITGSMLSEKEKKGFATLLPDLEYYAIRFSDNGIGFEEEYAENIFSVFQRLHQHSEYGGYGIGLALCSRVVNNHHGVIYATGKPGEGSIFTAILPLRQQK
ncbi:MAG: PAS domain-containing protein [Bacteroidota bacterium]